jgi:hypothetical protein
MSRALPSERVAVVGVIQPINGNNATTLTAAIDMQPWGSLLAILQVGVIDQVVDFKLQECATSGGSYTDISGKSITQAAATDDGKTYLINLQAEELASGSRYVKASVTVGNGTSSLVSVVCLGFDAKYGPGSDSDLTSVAQIVT